MAEGWGWGVCVGAGVTWNCKLKLNQKTLTKLNSNFSLSELSVTF